MPMDFETVVVTTDLLIIGGGMGSCGAAVEASYWGKKHGVKVTLVDKASMPRSGAVGMGLSAINLYVGLAEGKNTVEDYIKYVKYDLMGVARDDLVANIARHVDSSVHLFDQWGLPLWKDDDGNYVHEGRWQLMISGESYKVIVAEAAKNALGEENIYERVFITEPLIVDGKCVGAVGFSVRENKIYVFKAKAVMCALGGTVGVFKPKSTGEGCGRSWYPPFSTGSSAYFTMKAGAEMTCQEIRFVPIRFKDAYGPVGAWFLLFKSKATNAIGENYMQTRKDELLNWGKYGAAIPQPANLRNHLGLLEIKAGNGPLMMRTDEAISALAKQYEGDEKAYKKKMKTLENEAWEDFLDMTISQALLWAATNVEPEVRPSEIGPTEPYFISSHSGGSGAWVSGPEDLSAGTDYFWGYAQMTTVPGLFAAGDATGACAHKFSSGTHAEGRIAGKSAIKYILENNTLIEADPAVIEKMKEVIIQPLALFEQYKDFSTDENVNPNYIIPKQYMFRLQKIMDEYVGGVSSNFATNKASLDRAAELLVFLKEDGEKLAARDLYELLRVWENKHRLWQAESHLRAVAFREETRWPGYYFRTDYPTLNEDWECFVNMKWDPIKDEWSVFKRPVLNLFGIE